MKWINKLSTAALAFTGMLTLASCEKDENIQVFEPGSPVTLSSSVTMLAPIAGDSARSVVTFSWTDPGYATTPGTNKYILQIDSAGRNFSNAITREISNNKSYSFLAKDINKALLDSLGFVFGKPGTVDVRVISSYANNNERLNSNTVKVNFTPYKVPPRVTLPSSGRLYIVGDATDGGWNNPVPAPAQEFARIDETTFGGVFYLYGGAQYLMLPVNGSWDNKYSVGVNTLPDLNMGGDFGFNLRDNFPGPQVDGFYKITVDFQTGKFKVEPFTAEFGVPSQLVMVGGATPGGWDNNANNTQKFTRLNSAEFEISIALKSGDKYLILPEPGSWDKKYGTTDNSTEASKLGGTLKPQGADIAAPNENATYKVRVNFWNMTYKVTKA